MIDKKNHFKYDKSQRNGIFYLGIIIIILQLFYHLFDFSSSKIENVKTPQFLALQNKIDSLKVIEINNRKPKIFPFNPSFITDYKGYKLGMSIQEIDKLHTYRKKGKYINSTRQFQQVTGVNDSLLHQLKPHFKFPDWLSKKPNSISRGKFNYKNVEKDNNNNQENKIKIKDINKAEVSELKSIYGIGDKLAERIIKFRNKIGGFYFEDQLNEVYGLKPEVILRLNKKFKILSKPKINKININEASFKEILHLPYIDYKLTKNIFEYKDEFAEIQNIEELKKIDSFPIDKYDRIILYLKTE